MKSRKTEYSNKIFSYRNKELAKRNYSRKNFKNTCNYLVAFNGCKFEQTIFQEAKFENCIFRGCIFKNFEFAKIIFSNVSFVDCKFNGILFNYCQFVSVIFDECEFCDTIVYPTVEVRGLNVNNDCDVILSSRIMDALEKVKLQKYIRESNTIFKKVRNTRSKDTKKKLKKISKKEGNKIGMTKQQRLAENARRKKERNALHRQNYEDSQMGKNRKLDEGVMRFLMTKYTDDELVKGLEYAIEKMDFSFHELSFIMKYIDEANM